MKNVYLIQIEGMDICKIGNSKNPKSRLKSIQTGNPFKVILVDFYPTHRATIVETTLHRRFSLHKVNEDEFKLQGEWFRLDLTIRKSFKELCKKIDTNFQIIEDSSTLYN